MATDAAADRLFATIDTDENGSLSQEELLVYLLGAGVEHEEIGRIFKALDADSDGKITPDEWRAGYARYVSPKAELMSGMRQYTTKAALEAARRDAAAGEADDVALLDAQWLLKFDTHDVDTGKTYTYTTSDMYGPVSYTHLTQPTTPYV